MRPWGKGSRWDTGRLTGEGWNFVVDLKLGGHAKCYAWIAIGKRFFWVKLRKERL